MGRDAGRAATRDRREGRPAVALSEVLRRVEPSGAPIQAALRVGAGIARDLHETGHVAEIGADVDALVPRRLDPDRIWLGLDGGIWLDLAGSTRRGPRSSSSWEHAAPEVLLGETSDGRAALFSLGVLLFELLAGARLYHGEPQEIAARVVEEPPPDLGEARADCPADLVELLFELLCKEASARPASPGEVARRLEAMIDERVSWEGEVGLAAFLAGLVAPEALEAEYPSGAEDGERDPAAPAPSSPRTPGPRRLLWDVVVVALLLGLSAVAGWLVRALFG